MIKKMQSKFPGTCRRGGDPIQSGDLIEWDSDTRASWHVACSGKNLMAPEPKKKREILPADESVPNGTFSVVFKSDEFEEYQTLRIRRKVQGNFKGKMIAEYFFGPDNTKDFKGFAFVEGRDLTVWRDYKESPSLARWTEAFNVIINGGDKEAGLAYAMHSGNCYRCGKVLTVPASLNRGLGPDCAKKGN